MLYNYITPVEGSDFQPVKISAVQAEQTLMVRQVL